jgi:hypothetical protein
MKAAGDGNSMNGSGADWHQRVKGRLAELKMPQSAVARDIGDSKFAVCRWLRGEAQPRLEEFRQVVQALNVTSDWILSGGQYTPKLKGPKTEIDAKVLKLAEFIAGLPANRRRDLEGFIRVCLSQHKDARRN